MEKQNRKVRIAIQKNGRLREPSERYLRGVGLEFSFSSDREYLVSCKNAEIEVLRVRNSDIPKYVEYGTADFGVVGENILFDQESRVTIVKKLGFGRCSLVIAVPKDGRLKTIDDLAHERIATSYSQSVKRFLQERGIDASIIEIKGSVEIAPQLGLADAICDITQTGTTLQEHNLVVLEKILDSEAVLIESPTAVYGKNPFTDGVH